MNMVIVDPTVDAQLIKVSSLKAIYFTFSPTSWLGTESFDQTDYQCSLGAKSAYTGTRVMKTTWSQNNLANYQFFLDGKPTPASPVTVRLGYSETLAELGRALHFGHKSAYGNYLSLLEDNGAYQKRNKILDWVKSLIFQSERTSH